MEIEGHPTQDLLEELERRGALRMTGTTAGPTAEAARFVEERFRPGEGYWMYLPYETFRTGIDEIPT